MIKIEKTQIVGLEPTIRGMRNPMNSWAKSDSVFTHLGDDEGYDLNSEIVPFASATNMCGADIGPNDLDLMLRLAKAGSVDGKFRRMITVYVDLTAPLYWWKEFDTYKVGTVANSCSTMHKIHAKEFTLEDFSHEHLYDDLDFCFSEGITEGPEAIFTPLDVLECTVNALNTYRNKFLEIDSEIKKCHFNELDKREELVKRQKQYWWQMIQLLPSSYNQKRTVMLNYEVLANIYQHRRNHKLDEWRELCKWIEGLPYSEVITCNVAEKDKNNALTSAITKLKAELQWGDDQIAEFLLEQAMLFTGEKKVDVTHLFNPN